MKIRILFKPAVLSVLFLCLFIQLRAQCDRALDASGNLLYQFSRTFERNPDNPDELLVTFVFVNGNAQRAITLRQETLSNSLRWIDTSNGGRAREAAVASVTANLAPGQGVAWKYAVTTPYAKPEQAALMIMDEKYAVQKIFLQ